MNSAVYDFHTGELPLLISVPHDGRALPDEIAARMTATGRELPDTDWHVAQLYDFVRELGASMICARYSRYVVDLNRPADDTALYAGQVATGLCPERTFAGEDIYRADDSVSVSADERALRIERYWRPYHERIASTLAEFTATHGYALLWDAHSIASEVPGLFDGALPVLNIGTNNGRSCAPAIETALARLAASSNYSSVCNGRFTGGHITRHFGQPEQHIHAVQMELAQRSYMDEKTLRYDQEQGAALRQVLAGMLETFLQTAKSLNA